MLRINVIWLIDVVKALDDLDGLEVGAHASDIFYTCFSAINQIDAVLQQSVYRQYIRISAQRGDQLRSTLTDMSGHGADYELAPFDIWKIKSERDQFKQILLAEMSTIPTYLVLRKSGYETDALVFAGDMLFPSGLMDKAPETIADAKEAGRALAFELPTACGFHVFRVVEAVTKRYWDKATSGAARPRVQSLGSFVAELDKLKLGDTKIVESIRQLTRLHRNPLVHPEALLTTEEAIGIIGLARSVVGAMLASLPEVAPTTSSPQAVG